jgi:uncharacterized protein (TIGR00369 family)
MTAELNPPDLNPPDLNPPSLAEAVNARGFTGAAGFRIVKVEPGFAELSLARRDDLLQFFGHFHGGVITALADQAAGIAVTSGRPKGRIGVTVELKVNFLSPANRNELVARPQPCKCPAQRCRHRRNLQPGRKVRAPMRILHCHDARA